MSASARKLGNPVNVTEKVANLKKRQLQSLNKLGDRDTLKTGAEELAELVEILDADTLPIFLGCLLDTNEIQKPFARRESVKLFGLVAHVHQKAASPYLPKVTAALVRRLKDTDTSVRDACAEAFGLLARYVPPLGPNAQSMSVYFKPLFHVLSEQNKNTQMGAALCISKVIQFSGASIEPSMERLVPRLVKHLCHPACLCRSLLLNAIGHLVEAVGEAVLAFLPVLMPPTLDALELQDQADWPVRKAAAEVLEILATRLGPVMSPWRDEVIECLSNCKFDRVKPVREVASDALILYRELPGPSGVHEVTENMENGGSANRPPNPDRRSREGTPGPGPLVRPTTPSGPASIKRNVRSQSPAVSDRGQRAATPSRSSVFELPPNSDFFKNAGDVIKASEREGQEGMPTAPAGQLRGAGGAMDSNARVQPVHRSAPAENYGYGRAVPSMAEDITSEEVRGALGKEARPARKENRPTSAASMSGGDADLVNKQLKKMATQQQQLMQMLEEFTTSTRTGLNNMETRLNEVEKTVGVMYKRGNQSSNAPNAGITPADRHSQPRTAGAEGGLRSRRNNGAGPTSTGGVWTTVTECLAAGAVEDAYATMVNENPNEDVQLVRLMGRTGPVFGQLYPDTAAALIERFTFMLRSGNFVDNVFPWLHDLSENVPSLNVPLPVVKGLCSILHDMSAAPTHAGIEAAQLHSLLVRHCR